jgi:hypothetical protein
LNFPQGTLFNRVDEVDPLTCPKYQGNTQIIVSIENPEVIKKILRPVGLWHAKKKQPPLKANAPSEGLPIDYNDSHIQYCNDDYSDPAYAFEAYIKKGFRAYVTGLLKIA